jgi:hypothetical protein
MVAHATGEAHSATPWWRTLKIGGELNAKYPGGIEAQMARLEPKVIPWCSAASATSSKTSTRS